MARGDTVTHWPHIGLTIYSALLLKFVQNMNVAILLSCENSFHVLCSYRCCQWQKYSRSPWKHCLSRFTFSDKWNYITEKSPFGGRRNGLDGMVSFVRFLFLKSVISFVHERLMTHLNSASWASPQTYRIIPSLGRKHICLSNTDSGLGASGMNSSSSLKLKNKGVWKGMSSSGAQFVVSWDR